MGHTMGRPRRGRPEARWTAGDMAEVVEAVLRARPDLHWSAEDVRDRLAFGHEGAGPALSSVREALRGLVESGRVERSAVWGLQGWGNTTHAYRAPVSAATRRTLVAA